MKTPNLQAREALCKWVARRSAKLTVSAIEKKFNSLLKAQNNA